MEHFWNLLFQLKKHGSNTLHVAFVFLFSIVSSPNRSDATDVFVRRLMFFVMCPGLRNTTVALPPSTAHAEGLHWRIEMQPMQNHIHNLNIQLFMEDFLLW
jgi:hypothetical protein